MTVEVAVFRSFFTVTTTDKLYLLLASPRGKKTDLTSFEVLHRRCVPKGQKKQFSTVALDSQLRTYTLVDKVSKWKLIYFLRLLAGL